MNRYVVRALVAVLTFCIGVAVGRGPRRPRNYHERGYCRKVVTLGQFQQERTPDRADAYSGPFVSIDTAQSDPMKLTYSSTTSDQVPSPRQHVEFLVNRFSNKAIANYTVSYRTSFRYGDHGTVDVFRKAPTPSDAETFSVECDSRETLTVWVSRVQFKDGSSWENPRHRVGQSNL